MPFAGGCVDVAKQTAFLSAAQRLHLVNVSLYFRFASRAKCTSLSTWTCRGAGWTRSPTPLTSRPWANDVSRSHWQTGTAVETAQLVFQFLQMSYMHPLPCPPSSTLTLLIFRSVLHICSMEDFYPNKNHGPDSGIGSDNGDKRLSTTEVRIQTRHVCPVWQSPDCRGKQAMTLTHVRARLSNCPLLHFHLCCKLLSVLVCLFSSLFQTDFYRQSCRS